MPAYLIGQIDVRDPEQYGKYRELVRPTVQAHGARVLVATDQAEVVEGSWSGNLTVVLEFPSLQSLKDWYNSPGYKPARDIRWQAANSNLIFAEGFAS